MARTFPSRCPPEGRIGVDANGVRFVVPRSGDLGAFAYTLEDVCVALNDTLVFPPGAVFHFSALRLPIVLEPTPKDGM